MKIGLVQQGRVFVIRPSENRPVCRLEKAPEKLKALHALGYKMPLRNGKHCRSIWRNSTKICISQKKIVPLQAILIIS